MIEVVIKGDKNGNYSGFSVSGHAGYAESGSDIYCSAVSTLVINTINSIEKFTDSELKVKSDEKNGVIEAEFTSRVCEKAEILMKSLVLGLESVKGECNGKYIKIFFKEV